MLYHKLFFGRAALHGRHLAENHDNQIGTRPGESELNDFFEINRQHNKEKMKQTPEKYSSIEKILAILSAFKPHNQEMGTVEISQKLGLHKATVSRILLTLSEHSYLRRNLKTKKFSLGPAILQLARVITQSLENNIIQIAKPHIDGLRDSVKETVVLEVVSGKNTMIAYLAEVPRKIRLAGTLGDVLPLHTAAGAKAILAFSPPELKDSLLPEKLRKHTPNSITDLAVLHQQYAEILECGYSIDNEEHDIGVSAIGAPILNSDEEPVAALVIVGPSQWVTWEGDSSLVPKLKKAAAAISADLYFPK